MNRIFTRVISFDFEGNAIVEIPDEIVKELQLEESDIMVFEHIQDKIIIRKRKDL